jgi:hypothetical protein
VEQGKERANKKLLYLKSWFRCCMHHFHSVVQNLETWAYLDAKETEKIRAYQGIHVPM